MRSLVKLCNLAGPPKINPPQKTTKPYKEAIKRPKMIENDLRLTFLNYSALFASLGGEVQKQWNF